MGKLPPRDFALLSLKQWGLREQEHSCSLSSSGALSSGIMVLALSQAVGPRRRASAPRRRKKIHDDDDDKETTKRLQTVTELMVAHCHNCKSPHVPTKQCNVCLHNFCKQPDCGPAHLPCDKPVRNVISNTIINLSIP